MAASYAVPQAQNTFSYMQKQGVARPASPNYVRAAPAEDDRLPKPGQALPSRQQGNPMSAGQGMPPYVQPPVNPNGGNGMEVYQKPITEMTGTLTGGQTGQTPGTETWKKPVTETTGTLTGQPPAPTPQGPWGRLGEDLYNNWKNYKPGQPFTPGANPFSGGVNQQLGQSLSDSLQNPSAYNSDIVMGTRERLNTALQEDFNTSRQYLNEEMARRGIDPSTIHGGRLSDLLTNQNRAQADMNQQLLADQARQFGSDRSLAQNNAMNFSNNMFGQDLSSYEANRSREAQDFSQRQQELMNALGFGQQEFNNQMTVNQFNADQQNALNAWLLQLMGGTG